MLDMHRNTQGQFDLHVEDLEVLDANDDLLFTAAHATILIGYDMGVWEIERIDLMTGPPSHLRRNSWADIKPDANTWPRTVAWLKKRSDVDIDGELDRIEWAQTRRLAS